MEDVRREKAAGSMGGEAWHSRIMQSASSNLLSVFGNFIHQATTDVSKLASYSSSSAIVTFPVPFGDAPILPLRPYYSQQQQQQHNSITSAAPMFPSSVQIDGMSSKGGGGPAFVGQVFSMCDPSGTGLMAVTTHFQIPFLSKRTPKWIQKMLAMVTKNQKNGPVFRFFMDLNDAVAYVKRLNIPTGMVGSCRLDVAYDHFKEKPHTFQFVPNGKQVKAANKILKTILRASGKKRIVGVPVFTAQNLNIAIATTKGIKWYTPYFFDKGLLDNILEVSIDQHFHTLIQNRHTQRRRNVIDDNLAAEVVEDNGENLFEPPEVQQVLDEMGHPGIPWGVVSKAAEVQLLDVVDKVLLGNRLLRKATGIQPKFPYLVDSFEERTAASLLKASSDLTGVVANSKSPDAGSGHEWKPGASEVKSNESMYNNNGIGQRHKHRDFRLPFVGDWFSSPCSQVPSEEQNPDKQIKLKRMRSPNGECINRVASNPLLPKITMVGISTTEAGGQMSRASLKKTMENLTRELEQTSESSQPNEDKDPLFVANVGDYSGITKTSTA
ncbi:tic22-like family protein [Tasmannia lanceolata]|uniref:tic22-like family protein n=1 Tax=Tasmannia lanceolata TaxID=3420 RepID=UPI004062CB64